MTAVYVRQSIDKKDSISIETQIELCKKEVSQDEQVEIYQDKGFSGKNTDRPAFKRMMQDVESGKINKIIVYRLDRVSRSVVDFANIINTLSAHNADFISTVERFDTSTPIGRAMVYIIMVFAQLERETIAERIKDNYFARGRSGCWLGGQAPYGFKIDRILIDGRNTPTICPTDEVEDIVEIFDLYANTSAALARIARSMREKRGINWDNVKVSRILRNPSYVKAGVDIFNYYKSKGTIIINPVDDFKGVKGLSLHGKRSQGGNRYNELHEQVISVALHDGIIDESTWLRCQYKLDGNKQIKNSGKGKHTWLTGIVKCGYCGYGMKAAINGDSRNMYCTGKESTFCPSPRKTHRIKDLESAIEKELIKYVSENAEAPKARPEKDTEQINKIKIEISKIEEQIERLVASIADGTGGASRYIKDKIDELDTERSILLEKITRMSIDEPVKELPDLSDWDSLDMEGKREHAHAIIDKAIVFEDEIQIKWLF